MAGKAFQKVPGPPPRHRSTPPCRLALAGCGCVMLGVPYPFQNKSVGPLLASVRVVGRWRGGCVSGGVSGCLCGGCVSRRFLACLAVVAAFRA